jgi:hypothetical protein
MKSEVRMLVKLTTGKVVRDAASAVGLALAILFVVVLERINGPEALRESKNLLGNSENPIGAEKSIKSPQFAEVPTPTAAQTKPKPATASAAIPSTLQVPKPSLNVNVAAKKRESPIESAARAPSKENAHSVLPLLAIAPPQPNQLIEKRVEFFAVKAKAQSVVFVVDCSGSMMGRRFDRACLELATAIMRLQPTQEFFVIFFNSNAIPMPNGSLPNGLRMASTSTKFKTTQWMLSIVPFDGTDPSEAMHMAAGLKPDVIFLLSDGEFAPLDPRLLQSLRNQKTIVNTLAFEDQEGAKLLESIAGATGGAYRFVPTDDAPTTSLADLCLLLTDRLIIELRSPTVETRREAHATLVELARRDLGPASLTDNREVEQAVDRWVKWGRDRLMPMFTRADDDSIVAYLQNPGRIARWLAASIVEHRRLNVPGELIASFEGADRDSVQMIRKALIHAAAGLDFGPADNASDEARSRAVARWTRWLQASRLISRLASGNRDALGKALKSTNPIERWAAVMAVRQRKLELIREIFDLLRDTDSDVRAEVRTALVSCASRNDLGPTLEGQTGRYIPDELLAFLNDRNADARDESWQALSQITGTSRSGDWDPVRRRASDNAAKRVTQWWIDKKEDRAAIQLRQAKILRNAGRREVAEQRLKLLIATLPGTPSADEAKRLLAQSP